MFTAQLVQVQSVGEHVTLAIGNWQRQIHYESAILLAWWMLRRGREAKRWAGTTSRTLYGIGTLHDASNPNFDAGQPLTLRRQVSRDLLKIEQIEVEQRNAEVLLRFGRDEIAVPWKAALTISQWLRQRAKESKRRAGDTDRHWNRIVLARDNQVGADVTRG